MHDDEQQLSGMRVAIVARDMVEEEELIAPREALEAAGAETDLVSVKEGEIISANHFDKSETYTVDATLDEIEATDYDAVLLPGGAMNADSMRAEPRLQQFLQQIDAAGKPMAIICHAAWELIDAGLVEGRTLTSYPTIAKDIENAGGEWIDQAVVLDNNWVTSRRPADIPKFNHAMINLFAQFRQNGSLAV